MLSAGDKVVFWVFTGFLGIFTIFFNMYLLLVNQKSYRKNHKLNPADFIIAVFAGASITQQIASYLWQTMDKIDLECKLYIVAAVLLVITFSLKLIIIWSMAFLTFYYSTKLVVQPVHCYTRIQEAIVKHVHIVSAVIVVSGFANCIPLLTVLTYHNRTSHISDCGSLMPDDNGGLAYIFYYVVISDIVPGIVMVKCCISILYHLAKHLRHMKASTNGSHGPKLGTQMRVIKMTITLEAVFLSFLAVDLFTQFTVVLKRQNTITLTILFSSIYTMVSAFVLIYGKKSCWKELIASYNLFLDEYPVLSGMKVTEVKTEPHENSHVH
ncbi:taste receptor type 2 member 136-like [Myxocyprinus asiaticus]|uniref:taste receptor type 2 member 136-like n=1 Tax=Myxocyprinus asiaticus TaxID=70543 RepID=UPI002221D74B|nr:taste receptor type 2 member 136-like [Myxocyprinus asiaticus]